MKKIIAVAFAAVVTAGFVSTSAKSTKEHTIVKTTKTVADKSEVGQAD